MFYIIHTRVRAHIYSDQFHAPYLCNINTRARAAATKR